MMETIQGCKEVSKFSLSEQGWHRSAQKVHVQSVIIQALGLHHLPHLETYPGSSTHLFNSSLTVLLLLSFIGHCTIHPKLKPLFLVKVSTRRVVFLEDTTSNTEPWSTCTVRSHVSFLHGLPPGVTYKYITLSSPAQYWPFALKSLHDWHLYLMLSQCHTADSPPSPRTLLEALDPILDSRSVHIECSLFDLPLPSR